MTDEYWMQRALNLALRGKGHVEPNPMVGCVIVRDDCVLAEGHHAQFGEQHAERAALEAVSEGESVLGATWYVTLEPCCHTGKTPPCVDTLIAQKPGRVVVAMTDPFPQVAGQGIKRLRDAGIEVVEGVCESEACRLNAPYLKKIRVGRPWVIAKWAMTLDGRIATHTGDSQWISAEATRHRVHELRGRCDGVMVGAGTAAADNPRLTARLGGPRIPERIVFSRQANLALDSELVRTSHQVPVRLFTGPSASEDCRSKLTDAGVHVVVLASDESQGMVLEALDYCGTAGMTNVLVEGGGELLGSFFDADAIDEYHVAIAPKVFGGAQALGPIAGQGIKTVLESPRFQGVTMERIGDDIIISACREG